jgi:cell division protein FtsW
VAQRSADPFGRLVAAAITAWLVGQALINMGAVVGLLPITGIPLPLISFGGSSLLITMFAIGILLSLAKTEPAAAQVIAARAATRSAGRLARRKPRFGFLGRRRANGKKAKNGKQNKAANPPRSRRGEGARGTARKAGREQRGSAGRGSSRGRARTSRDPRSRRRQPSR